MISVFALYVPQLSGLSTSIAVLAIVFLVLCGCAYRAQLSVWKSALAMLIGAGVALVPLLNSVWNADLGDYGDLARERSGTNYSDTFFAATSLMEVGWGKMIVFAGMVGGLLLVVFRTWIQPKSITSSTVAATTPDSVQT